MSKFTDQIARLVDQAGDERKIPASQIAGQLAGTQVAPAASGSPGVVDRDDLVTLSPATPQPLGIAAAGSTGDASDAGHVHVADASPGTALREAIDDAVAGLLVAGASLTLAYDDATGTLTIAVSAATSSVAGSMSAADKSKLDGVTALADPTGATIHAAAGKAAPVDADEIALIDSAAGDALRRLTWSDLKAALKAYFDTLYLP